MAEDIPMSREPYEPPPPAEPRFSWRGFREPLTAAPWPPARALALGIGVLVIEFVISRLEGSGGLLGSVSRAAAGQPSWVRALEFWGVLVGSALILYGALMLIVVRGSPRKDLPFSERFGLRPFVPAAVFIVPAFVLLGYIANIVWDLVLFALRVAPPATANQLVQVLGTSVFGWLYIFGLACVVAPFVEELVFRGVVFASLREAWGETPALFASAFLFGLAHVDWRVILPTMVLGLLLGKIFSMTRSIWASMLTHSAFNFFAIVLVLLAVDVRM